MSCLDPLRLYTLIVLRGSSATEMHKAFRAHDANDAYQQARDAGFAPVAILCVN